MKSENYEKLKQFDYELNAALRYDYLRITIARQNELFSIYENEYNEKLNMNQRTCRKCILTAIKRLASDYDKYKITLTENTDNNGGNQERTSTKKATKRGTKKV